MNVLFSFNVAAKNGIFRFHTKCKETSLTYLCFADDLLLFCHGLLDSILGVVSILEKFYEFSGLRLNALKSELFVCGVPVSLLDQIQSAIGFKIGQLPVRYLRVSLVTRKLTSKDCSALLVKIKNRIDHWSSRKLSFGGRLQLVKSVLSSIFGYWSRQIILPKGVVNDIEKLCMRFFWKSSDTTARGARVSWSQICSLKSEGGLGLRRLVDWSKACCLMLVKNILAGEGSLWIAWIKDYCFKSLDYWNVDRKPHFSWILNKLIKLREEARRLFISVSIWPQIKGGWIWDRICDRRDKVGWHRLIWFPSHIPKFSIIAWMVILDRLPTKDRLARFGIVTVNVCGLCGDNQESRNHLFLECSFARVIWKAILHACGLQLQLLTCWDNAMHWMISNLKGEDFMELVGAHEKALSTIDAAETGTVAEQSIGEGPEGDDATESVYGKFQNGKEKWGL
ncbi:hypothetical protein F3Y22_tig00110809pilonHSYRG00241 [Hibiscus syriacus]|uniref:Reverse transcriptase zinc-binding domain-containing protein n=1 Tax=Hibiscus syriacus TaxID=106335 RepID=A0A6A2ZQ88_HIBSY|nr:hypothetical protein F3Y22_tig00110809pilonHSYRG00241 [Hibiscus syriacus]